MEQTQRNFEIPESLVSALLNYLNTRPAGEVNRYLLPLYEVVKAQLSPEELAAATGQPIPAPAPAATAAPQLVKA